MTSWGRLAAGMGIALWVTTAHDAARAELPGQSAQQAAYVSPYQYAESLDNPELTRDFHEMPRALDNWRNWSLTPFHEWHDFRVIERLHTTWGPHYIFFRAPRGALERPPEWFQKRIVVAARVVRNSSPYGHHHMAQWSVPDEPRWTEHHYEPGYGFDCSDFTNFAYRYGVGIVLETGIVQQSNMQSAPMHLADGAIIHVQPQRLFDVQNGYTKSYDDLTRQLQPGDLLYIRGNASFKNPITHVIMWMGDLAHDTKSKDPHLIMDGHGAVVKDSNGNLIPSGPELRPFTDKSYYFRSFDHVLRYVPLTKE